MAPTKTVPEALPKQRSRWPFFVCPALLASIVAYVLVFKVPKWQNVEQLTVSLSATDDKISQIDAKERRKNSPVFVGMPPISQLVVREAESRDKTD